MLNLVLAAFALGRAVPHVSFTHTDEVTSLPGWEGPLPSRMFSGASFALVQFFLPDFFTFFGFQIFFSCQIFAGYLNITDTKHIHYVFSESESDPANDPVVLWFVLFLVRFLLSFFFTKFFFLSG
jgi:hypothetical protein